MQTGNAGEQQMTCEEILSACRMIKESGTSSKVPIPIVTLEQLARDAAAWRSAPDQIKDAAKMLGVKT